MKSFERDDVHFFGSKLVLISSELMPFHSCRKGRSVPIIGVNKELLLSLCDTHAFLKREF